MEDFEKDIKKHFQQRQIQPSENTWEKMEQLLNADKPVQRKPRKLYYFLSAVASVLLFVGLWSFFKNDNHSIPVVTPSEVFVVNDEIQVIQPAKSEKEHVLQEKKLITNTISVNKRHSAYNHPSQQIAVNHEVLKDDTEKGDLKQDYRIIEKADMVKEEPLLVEQSKIEIKVNPSKLLQSAEMERQTDNMVSNGQHFWKKVKEINTVVVHSK